MLEDVEFQVGFALWYFTVELTFPESQEGSLHFLHFWVLVTSLLDKYQMAWKKMEFSFSSRGLPTLPGTSIYFREKDLDLQGTAECLRTQQNLHCWLLQILSGG